MTPSQDHYIKTVFELNKDGYGARITDIASKMNVSKPSACTAMKNLEQKNLVKTMRYHTVYLTAEGKTQALRLRYKYTAIKQFLIKIVGVSEKTAAVDACGLEHIISNETFNALISCGRF